jgi:hypothetical protein
VSAHHEVVFLVSHSKLVVKLVPGHAGVINVGLDGTLMDQPSLPATAWSEFYGVVVVLNPVSPLL